MGSGDEDSTEIGAASKLLCCRIKPYLSRARASGRPAGGLCGRPNDQGLEAWFVEMPKACASQAPIHPQAPPSPTQAHAHTHNLHQPTSQSTTAPTHSCIWQAQAEQAALQAPTEGSPATAIPTSQEGCPHCSHI